MAVAVQQKARQQQKNHLALPEAAPLLAQQQAVPAQLRLPLLLLPPGRGAA